MKKIIGIFFAALVLQSCSSSKDAGVEKTMWVSGFKTEASAGAGKAMVLKVSEDTDYKTAVWKNFYAPIEGFSFEEGFLKQIKVNVKETKQSPDQVPADASTLKYDFIEELQKVPDTRVQLDGEWLLVKLNDGPINRMVVVPTLKIELDKMHISGNDGCNSYSSDIKNLTFSNIEFGMAASTKKACMAKDIAMDYYKALAQVNSYKFDNDKLIFMNKNGESVLTFLSK